MRIDTQRSTEPRVRRGGPRNPTLGDRDTGFSQRSTWTGRTPKAITRAGRSRTARRRRSALTGAGGQGRPPRAHGRREHPPVGHGLEPLDRPGRYLAPALHRPQVPRLHGALSQRTGQRVRRGDGVLDREVDPHPAHRRPVRPFESGARARAPADQVVRLRRRRDGRRLLVVAQISTGFVIAALPHEVPRHPRKDAGGLRGEVGRRQSIIRVIVPFESEE